MREWQGLRIAPMACPRCGCHMVSRAGEGSGGLMSRLVCTRCNHPIETQLDPTKQRRRLGNVATLLALVFAGGLLFTLSALHDLRAPPPEPAAEPEEG